MKVRKNTWFFIGYGLWILTILVVLGSSTSGCTATGPAITAEEGARMDSLLSGETLMFKPQYAMPVASQAYLSAANLGVGTIRGSSPTQLNIQGEGYYLTLKTDSVSAYLPYFGIRDNMTNYQSGKGGIEVHSQIEERSVRPIKEGRQLEFFGRSGYERFRFILIVTPGERAQVSVFSPQRDVMRFSGTLEENE